MSCRIVTPIAKRGSLRVNPRILLLSFGAYIGHKRNKLTSLRTQLDEREPVRELFPPKLEPRAGQLEALTRIETAFDQGKRFFILEGPTGFGKSAVAKAALNVYGTGFITSPLNSLVGQYARDTDLELTEVRGQSTYQCRAFKPLNCEQAGDRHTDHAERCSDYIVARDAFWTAQHGVTNVHFLFYAPPIDGAFYPRKILVVDEAHNLESILISMCERRISQSHIKNIHARPFEFPGEDRTLLHRKHVKVWLQYFESAITSALDGIEDSEEKRDYESLREGINFTLNSERWIGWKEQGRLVIKPQSAIQAAKRLFRCADRVLFMSATMGDISVFCKALGIDEREMESYSAECEFLPKNRQIIYTDLGSMSKLKGQPGLSPMLQECARILRERSDERGIIHCHSRELQRTVVQCLREEFGNRIITHQGGVDRDAAIERLRARNNGVLCAVAMTEGLDLRDDDARFCIFAKIPWPNLADPYIKARKEESPDWYENMTALAVVQGSGRVVRNDKDFADTFIFDNTFPLLMPRFPEWFRRAVKFNPQTSATFLQTRRTPRRK